MGMFIRLRLVLLVLGVLAPALMLALWAVFRAYQAEHAALAQSAQGTTRIVAMLVDREFTKYRGFAQALAASPALASEATLAEADLRQLERTVERFLEGSPATAMIVGENRTWIDTTRYGEANPTAAMARPEGSLALRVAPTVEAVRSPGGEVTGVALIEPVYLGDRGVALNVVVLLPVNELRRILQAYTLHGGWTGLLLDSAGQVAVRHAVGPAASPEFSPRTVPAQVEGRLDISDMQGNPLRAYFSKTPQGWTYVTAVPLAQLDMGVKKEGAWMVFGALFLLAATLAVASRLSRRVASAGRDKLLPPEDIAPVPDGLVQRVADDGPSRRERVEAVGRLTDSFVHEFNNLLGVISNSAHLVKRHTGDPRLTLPVEATLRAVDAASRITHQLQRFGDKRAAHPQLVDLSAWLPPLREMLGVVVGKRIEMTVTVGKEPLRVCVDPEELELGLFNAVLNAKETLADGGHIDVSAGVVEARDRSPPLPPGRYVEIRIEEGGPYGAAPPGNRWFEPPVSVGHSEPSGGFGLRQVQALCARAGGAVSVAVRPGRSTVVSLVFSEMAAPDGVRPERAIA